MSSGLISVFRDCSARISYLAACMLLAGAGQAQEAAFFDFRELVGNRLPEIVTTPEETRRALLSVLSSKIATSSEMAPIVRKLNSQIVPERNAVSQHGRLRVYAYTQKIGTLGVSGPGARLTVALNSRNEIVNAAGLLLVETTAQPAKIDTAKVERAAIVAWRDGERDRIGADRMLVRGVAMERDLSAVNIMQVIDFRSGEPMIVADVQSAGALVARVFLSTEDLSVLGIEALYSKDAFDHHPVTVAAHPQTNNPDEAQVAIIDDLPGSIIGVPHASCFQFPWFGECFLRPGNDKLVVYDFWDNPNASVIPVPPMTRKFLKTSTNPLEPGPLVPGTGLIAQLSGHGFLTLDMFAKAAHARQLFDTHKETTGWDHNPGAPFGVFERAPMVLGVNVSGGHPLNPDSDNGVFWNKAYDTAEEQAMWQSLGHPHFGFRQGTVAIHNEKTSVLLHEMGHFYDHHTALGNMGQGLNANSCVPDTIDESIPLNETIGDIFAIYGARMLYSGLTYTADTTPPENECTFLSISSNTARIPHESCITNELDIITFDEERPAPSTTQACSHVAGYRMGSVAQAMWKFMHGVDCEMSVPLNCVFETASPSDIMPPVLYALSLSNYSSYRDFFDSMRVWILANEGVAEAERFESIFSDHGLL